MRNSRIQGPQTVARDWHAILNPPFYIQELISKC